MRRALLRLAGAVIVLGVAAPAARTQAETAAPHRFSLRQIFDLEWAADPQISPDGRQVVFARSFYDVMKDAERSNLWIMGADGSDLRPLTTGEHNAVDARWSPDGTRLAFVSNAEGSSEIIVRWMDTGVEAQITRVEQPPGALAWSPDGKWIAFTKFVPGKPDALAIQMPEPPKGANWGPPIKYIDQLMYRFNGRGYLKAGHRHIFVVPATGGTPRQLTFGPYDDGAPAWTPNGETIVFSANRHPDPEYHPLNTEVYAVSVATGDVTALTDRDGPDNAPAVSPDGKHIAYVGFDDKRQGYQVRHLYVMDIDGSNKREVTAHFDRSVEAPVWRADGRGVFVRYDDMGDTKVGYVTLDGTVATLVSHVGGLDLGRPYGFGQFSVSRTGRIAYTETSFDHPADVAIAIPGRKPERITRLNDDLLAHETLATGEEIRFKSSFDGREIQGWVLKPPGFEPGKKYPLVLEIHGGPFLNYGDRWGAELQLYAAHGYLVLYLNPRGSTSYGEQFGNLINHDYPDHDFDDLMSGVNTVIARGWVDSTRMFVTGGSGGGVLSAWIVGHTHRFRAAVVQKPVINWYSWVLTSDLPEFGMTYWFPGPPWENMEHYMKRSPISYVGNVTTPTMLITGEVDYRTPSEEAEQFYEGLKLRKVPAAMVRIPDANHEISAKPSNMMAKVAYVLGWFRKYGGD